MGLPRALQDALSSYTWVDGEIIAGLVLGWNFGEGHLGNERLLEVLQKECDFAEGEVRTIMVEAHRFSETACTGVSPMRSPVRSARGLQPWTNSRRENLGM